MQQHPEAHIRRAVRLLAMVGELHKRGYQRLRVMPYFGSSGAWRCSIAPVNLFYRSNGAIHAEQNGPDEQLIATVARYSGGDGNLYFGWDDARSDNARSLADKFVERFRLLADCARGWDYRFGGWYLRLLGYAEVGWLPYVFDEYTPSSTERLHLYDFRPAEWRGRDDEVPVLPLPPPGKWDD